MNEAMPDLGKEQLEGQFPPLPETEEFEDEVGGGAGAIDVFRDKKIMDDLYRQQWEYLSKTDFFTQREKAMFYDILKKLIQTPYQEEKGSWSLAVEFERKLNYESKEHPYRLIPKLEVLGFKVEGFQDHHLDSVEKRKRYLDDPNCEYSVDISNICIFKSKWD